MLDDDQKLNADILKADLEAYRKLETWGSSLFLGAIGLIAKQLFEWDLSADPLKHIALSAKITTLPAAVGLMAFVFLRVVNTRSYTTGLKLRTLAGISENRSLGILGYMLASMPLLFGNAASLFLMNGVPERKCWSWWIIIFGVIIFLGSVVYHARLRAGKCS